MRRILFFSVSIGAGHDQAARNIAEWLEKDCTVRVVDALRFVSPTLHKIILNAYLRSLQYIPEIFRFLYDRSEQKDAPLSSISPALNSWVLASKLSQLIDDFAPDVIVCTHPFPAEAIAGLKRRRQLTAPLIVVITDFCLHACWINPGTDHYILPAPVHPKQLAAFGVQPEQTQALGLPVAAKLTRPLNREQTCRKLRVGNRPTGLIAGGSLGCGDIAKTLALVRPQLPELQFIVVCGKNHGLYAALQKNRPARTSILGFVENMEEWMTVSDFIITKPGGMTIAECLTKRLPLLLPWHLPGQEQRNAAFIQNHHLGFLSPPPELAAAIRRLQEPATYAGLISAINRMRRPTAAENIAGFIRHTASGAVTSHFSGPGRLSAVPPAATAKFYRPQKPEPQRPSLTSPR
jgi:processive 1,2-diacylglycerol beta-glucosyltransferase